MKTYVFDLRTNSVKVYPTRKDAQSSGNGLVIATNAEELCSARITNTEMVEFYNALTPNGKIKKFSDRATACKRLMSLAEAHARVIEVEPREKEVKVTEAAPTEVKKAPAPKKAKSETKSEGPSRRGRNSAFEGKRLFATQKENPRREGTHGHKSYAVLMQNPGITYEQFVALGGRRVDLAWDFGHDWVKVEG